MCCDRVYESLDHSLNVVQPCVSPPSGLHLSHGLRLIKLASPTLHLSEDIALVERVRVVRTGTLEEGAIKVWGSNAPCLHTRTRGIFHTDPQRLPTMRTSENMSADCHTRLLQPTQAYQLYDMFMIKVAMDSYFTCHLEMIQFRELILVI